MDVDRYVFVSCGVLGGFRAVGEQRELVSE